MQGRYTGLLFVGERYVICQLPVPLAGDGTDGFFSCTLNKWGAKTAICQLLLGCLLMLFLWPVHITDPGIGGCRRWKANRRD